MKKALLPFIAICMTLTVCYSQTKTKDFDSGKNVIEKDYLKGLRKPTNEEREKLSLQLTPNLDYYTEEGNKISFNEVLPLLKSGEYSLVPYINDSNELKAAVLRLGTKEDMEINKGHAKINKRSERVGKNAQPFNVTDINGNKYSLEELKGKIIVMNFWFVECKPCVMEIPELNELVENYKEKEIVFLGFATNKIPNLNSFLSKKEFKYIIIPESRDVISSYEINYYPTHIIIDKNSEIVFFSIGLGSHTVNDLENEIKKLLKE